MTKMFGSVALLAVAFVIASHYASGWSDTVLSHPEFATAFGSNAASRSCCLTIDACKVNVDSCTAHNNDQAGCNGGSQITLQNQYAKQCMRPPNPVPTYDCMDFPTDANGKSYYCIAVFDCNYEQVTGICSKGAANLIKCVVGVFDCGSNCPL